MPDSTVRRLPAWLLGSGLIAFAMGIMNLGTYGFTILAARLLGPSSYGALASVMGLLLVVSVASTGLQATGARRVSAAPQDLDVITSDMLTATYRSALAVGLICLLSVPLVTFALRLDSWLTAGMVALAAVPVTIMGGQAGILQGERLWGWLAAIYLGTGLGRIGFGTAALLVDAEELSAMTGVAVGSVIPVLVGWVALRRRPGVSSASAVPGTRRAVRGHSRHVLSELAHNSHALLAFFALTNVDVLVARVVLDSHLAGLYAGGLILAKAVLFLPQFVVVVAFPSMSAPGARSSMTLKALGMVLAIGVAATSTAWLLPDLTVQFVGGDAYAELTDSIWAFAAIGTLWATIQLLVYNVMAQQNKRAVAVVWAGLTAIVALAPSVTTVNSLCTVVLAVEGVVLLVLLAFGLRRTLTDTETVSA